MPWTCWGGEGPAAGAGIVLGKAAAWLHRHRGDAVVDEAEAGYVRSAGEGRLHRLDIAEAHRDCDVARDVLVHQRRAWRYRVRPHRGQRVVATGLSFPELGLHQCRTEKGPC